MLIWVQYSLASHLRWLLSVVLSVVTAFCKRLCVALSPTLSFERVFTWLHALLPRLPTLVRFLGDPIHEWLLAPN